MSGASIDVLYFTGEKPCHMPIVITLILALLGPRVAIALLWLFSNWFSTLALGVLVPILGFLFMPYTLLWYSVVLNLFAGAWGPLQLLGLILAIAFDLSSSGYGYRHYSHYHVVEHVEEV